MSSLKGLFVCMCAFISKQVAEKGVFHFRSAFPPENSVRFIEHMVWSYFVNVCFFFLGGVGGQQPLVRLLLPGPPFFLMILLLSTTLSTWMSGISLHMQWPLYSQREQFLSLRIKLHAMSRDLCLLGESLLFGKILGRISCLFCIGQNFHLVAFQPKEAFIYWISANFSIWDSTTLPIQPRFSLEIFVYSTKV
jgi:hypothetical protein